MEDEYFGVIRWCREDLIEALEVYGVEPAEDAVLTLYERVNTHWFADLMIEHGWAFIFSCMSDLIHENKLKKKGEVKNYD